MAVAIGLMNLTLGRLRAAEDAFYTMSLDSNDRCCSRLRHWRGTIRRGTGGLARRSTSGRAAAEAGPEELNIGNATLRLWTLIRAGLVREAEAYAASGIFDGDPTGWIHGGLRGCAR